MQHSTPATQPAAPPRDADMAERLAQTAEAPRDALSPREVAQRTGLSYHAVLREIRRGALQAKQVCDGSRILIPIAAYRAWLQPTDVEAGEPVVAPRRRRRSAPKSVAAQRGSFERLLALEEGTAA